MSNKKIKQHIITFMLIILFLGPVIYVIVSSFKPAEELYLGNLLPTKWTLDAYRNVFSQGDFLLYVFNTFFVSITSTVIAILVNTMSGYALAKFNFKGSNVIFMIIIATIMLPLEVIMVPIFSVLKATGLVNSLWALIIPPAATPMGIFLMRQYLLTIPDEIIQSARIDGASEFQIFFKIIIPNAKPAIATLAIFSFMWRWNDYIWPKIAIFSPEKYTLQMAIANFSGEYNVDWSSLLAVSTISMIPMLIMFLAFQKYFIQGTATSGMKG